jgi:hypothetical protein
MGPSDAARAFGAGRSVVCGVRGARIGVFFGFLPPKLIPRGMCIESRPVIEKVLNPPTRIAFSLSLCSGPPKTSLVPITIFG